MTDRATEFFQSAGVRDTMKRSMPPDVYGAWLRGQALHHAILSAQSGRREDLILTVNYADQALALAEDRLAYPDVSPEVP